MQICQHETSPRSVPVRESAAVGARARVGIALAALLLTAACGRLSNQPPQASEIESLKGQLKAERDRCEQMQRQALSYLPQDLQQIRLELSQANQQLPGKLRDQVQQPLAAAIAGLAKHLDQIDQRSTRLGEQLTSFQQTERAARDDLARKLDAGGQQQAAQVASDLSDILKEIQQFEQTKIACRDCQDHLHLDSHSRDALTAFNRKTYDRLREIVIRLRSHAT